MKHEAQDAANAAENAEEPKDNIKIGKRDILQIAETFLLLLALLQLHKAVCRLGP